MSPVFKLCPRHGRYQGRCRPCYTADNQRRAAKQRAQGCTTAHWQRLKAEAKALAGYRCQDCDKPEERRPGGWLSVHLPPEFGGNHRLASSPDQLAVLCLSCHGSLDAPRARSSKGGHRGAAASSGLTPANPTREKNFG